VKSSSMMPNMKSERIILTVSSRDWLQKREYPSRPLINDLGSSTTTFIRSAP
jgi:hypothetical protein